MDRPELDRRFDLAERFVFRLAVLLVVVMLIARALWDLAVDVLKLVDVLGK